MDTKILYIILKAILYGSIFYAVYWASKRFLKKLPQLKRRELKAPIEALSNSLKIIFLFLYLLTVLNIFDVDIQNVVAGLGLASFALGLALKDIISNALSGFLILIYRPFNVGDKVKMAEVDGEIVKIQLRYTLFKTEGATCLVPNSVLSTSKIFIKDKTPAEEKDTKKVEAKNTNKKVKKSA